jgi:hypothetical protein
MLELCYDILDELTEIKNDSVKKVIETNEDEFSRVAHSPDEFYMLLKSKECTHMFTLELDDNHSIPVMLMRELLDEITVRYFGDCGLATMAVKRHQPVNQYMTSILRDPLCAIDKEWIVDETFCSSETKKWFIFKMPIKMSGSATKVIRNTCNFFANVYSLMKKYELEYNNAYNFYCYQIRRIENLNYRPDLKEINPYGYKFKPATIITIKDYYEHKYNPQPEFENNGTNIAVFDGPTKSKLSNELYPILSEHCDVDSDRMMTELNKWWSKYKYVFDISKIIDSKSLCTSAKIANNSDYFFRFADDRAHY